MIRLATLSLLLFTATHTSAQEAKQKTRDSCYYSPSIAIGGLAGISFSNGSVWSTHKRIETGSLVSLKIGVVAEFETARNLYLQPGIAYTTNGYWIIPDAGSGTVSIRVHAIEFPLNIQYKVHIGRGAGLFFGAGAYYSRTISAERVNNTAPKSTTDLMIGPNEDAGIASGMFGWSVNSGYQARNAIFFRVAWQNGLSDYIPGDQGASYHPYQLNFCLGYLFKTSKQKSKIKTL